MPLETKKLPAVVPDKVGVLFRGDFPRYGKHDSPGKLGVPLLLDSFGGVPQSIAAVSYTHLLIARSAAASGCSSSTIARKAASELFVDVYKRQAGYGKTGYGFTTSGNSRTNKYRSKNYG